MKISYSIDEISEITGICRVSLYKHANLGRLKIRKLGRKSLILKDDLDAFLGGLESYPARNLGA